MTSSWLIPRAGATGPENWASKNLPGVNAIDKYFGMGADIAGLAVTLANLICGTQGGPSCDSDALKYVNWGKNVLTVAYSTYAVGAAGVRVAASAASAAQAASKAAVAAAVVGLAVGLGLAAWTFANM